jgi:hypothetical protein
MKTRPVIARQCPQRSRSAIEHPRKDHTKVGKPVRDSHAMQAREEPSNHTDSIVVVFNSVEGAITMKALEQHPTLIRVAIQETRVAAAANTPEAEAIRPRPRSRTRPESSAPAHHHTTPEIITHSTAVAHTATASGTSRRSLGFTP